MSQKKETKDRVCDRCKGTFRVTAEGIKNHAADCKRMVKLGLVNPGGVVLR